MRLVALLLALLALGGCYAVQPPSAPTERPPPVDRPPPPPPIDLPPPPPVSGDVQEALDAIQVGMTEAEVRALFTRPPVVPPQDPGFERELRWYFGPDGAPDHLLFVRIDAQGRVSSKAAVPVESGP